MNLVKISLFVCLLLAQSIALASGRMWIALSIAQRQIDVDHQLERQFQLDKQALTRKLARADFEGRSIANSTLELPSPNGRIQLFRVEQSPIMAPELAAKFPQFKTFRVQGIDDPALSGRLSLSKKGFHGMITGPQGTFYIDPQGNERYRVYDRRQQKVASSFHCGTKGHSLDAPVSTLARRSALRTPGSLRVYRLAVAATAEYTAAVSDSSSVTDAAKKADAMTEIGIAINRVNQIYQRDLGIKLELVGNNDQIIYTDANSDPYHNNDGNTMLDENQDTIDAVIGADNYDIGHVFSTGGGGIAEVASVCHNDEISNGIVVTRSKKAGGVTGLSNPMGEGFYIDYVAHEIGHQFGGEHTFNGTEGSCGGGNRWQATAFEPGSGSTIMSYGGICDAENITRNAIATFHAGTIDLADDFTAAGNLGASCGTTMAISNSFEPTVNAGADYTIPAQTPFILTANGADRDAGDSITYSWDEMDAGTATSSTSFGKDLGNNSLFRSYLPRAENQRHFPALGTTLQNLYDDSEVMACSDRSLNFRVTVLDGNSGIGRDDVRITVTKDAGPFEITSHASAQSLSPGFSTLSWNVANTNAAPVNCQSVDINLLAFNAARSRYTEIPLVTGSANDGSEQITIPDVSSSLSRLKIQCSNNVFYDISDADLIITGSQSIDTSDKPVNYDTDGGQVHNLSAVPAAVCELTSGTSGGGNTSGGGTTGGTTTKHSGSSGGFSSLDLGWLLLLLVGSVFQRKAIGIRVCSVRR